MHPFLVLIDAACCRNSHHYLAIDGLFALTCAQRPLWQRLFWKYHEDFLEGSKAPDTQFKDFTNHVLHVEDGHWGGAVRAASEWYQVTVRALRERAWRNVAYSAGVLSHYLTDPIHPFHTGQSVAERDIHRAVEWSICKAFRQLRPLSTAAEDTPPVTVERTEEGLQDALIEAAQLAHRDYQGLIDNYDFATGARHPADGLNDWCRSSVGALIRHASGLFGSVLSKAIEEAAVAPPRVSLSVPAFFTTMKIPIHWVAASMENIQAGREIRRMHDEWERTGRITNYLHEEQTQVREAFEAHQSQRPIRTATAGADVISMTSKIDWSSSSRSNDASNNRRKVSRPEVDLPRSVPLRRTDLCQQSIARQAPGLKTTQSTEMSANGDQFHLRLSDAVVEAPSIGPKTARRLKQVGIHTVNDLLNAEPRSVVKRLNTRWITFELFQDWQTQAVLVCRIPQLRGHDAQILVACDYQQVDDVANASPKAIWQRTRDFCQSSEGQRVLRDGKAPDKQEIRQWIDNARSARRLEEAA